jgi:hypothetical protein
MPRRLVIDTCPPGTWCLSPTNGFLGLLCLVLLIGFVAYVVLTKPIEAPYPKERREPDTTIVMPDRGAADERYTRAPEPQRFWNNGPEVPPRGALIPPDGGVLINIPTQGWPESYQPMGLLKQGDGKLLPLYGRRVASRADRFNYYTRTDTYNPVPLPIQYKRKDCQDPVGCQELFDGDAVKIIPTGEEATATLYRFDGPQYVPNLI